MFIDEGETEIGDACKKLIYSRSSNLNLFPSLNAELSNDIYEYFLLFKQVRNLLIGSEVVVCPLL